MHSSHRGERQSAKQHVTRALPDKGSYREKAENLRGGPHSQSPSPLPFVFGHIPSTEKAGTTHESGLGSRSTSTQGARGETGVSRRSLFHPGLDHPSSSCFRGFWSILSHEAWAYLLASYIVQQPRLCGVLFLGFGGSRFFSLGLCPARLLLHGWLSGRRRCGLVLKRIVLGHRSRCTRHLEVACHGSVRRHWEASLQTHGVCPPRPHTNTHYNTITHNHTFRARARAHISPTIICTPTRTARARTRDRRARVAHEIHMHDAIDMGTAQGDDSEEVSAYRGICKGIITSTARGL